MVREINYDEVFDAQQHFRKLLDSMARPGKINSFPSMDLLPPAGLNKAGAITGLALLNSDATFYAEGYNSGEIEEYIAINTAARAVSIGEADFIFIDGLADEQIIFEAKTGTLSYPEDSATFVIGVEALNAEPKDDTVMLTLKGPGIETEKVVYIKGIDAGLLKAVKEQNLEFPLGIDLVIADKQDNILCVPRSNRFELV